jgi:hypothetical protein
LKRILQTAVYFHCASVTKVKVEFEINSVFNDMADIHDESRVVHLAVNPYKMYVRVYCISSPISRCPYVTCGTAVANF